MSQHMTFNAGRIANQRASKLAAKPFAASEFAANRFTASKFVATSLAATLVAAMLAAGAPAAAQDRGVHYRFDARPPAGTVGRTRLEQGGPVHGYFQPVQITGPRGTLVGLPEQGEWLQLSEESANAGMLIGRPYRIKVTNIELHPGRECYPTIEIIDRTYPPAGMERRFPIQVVLNTDDLDLAMRGLLVTRVVYIEDPGNALPAGQQPRDQQWFDAGPGANPLLEADRLGRPVAILRIGGRVPGSAGGPDFEFTYGSPAWLRLPPPAETLLVPTTEPGQEPTSEPAITPVPMKTARPSRPAVGR
jgi:hypothetical protein